MQSGTQRTIGFAAPPSELYHAARKCPRCTESTPLPLYSQLGLTSPLGFISCPHPETITLHVGPPKLKIICHEALLGFFSKETTRPQMVRALLTNIHAASKS
jgi:hypothetical protein